MIIRSAQRRPLATPLKVDESLPVDTGEPTDKDIQAAKANWASMPHALKAKLLVIQAKSTALVAEVQGHPSLALRGSPLQRLHDMSYPPAVRYSDDQPRAANGEFGSGGEDAGGYRGNHTAPGPDYGAPMHDLAGETQTASLPADIYDKSVQAQYYGTGDAKSDKESFAAVNAAKDNPDAQVQIYRAVPEGATTIQPGDWVTASKSYAQSHLDGPLNGNGKILSTTASAKDLWTNGDSINEWGYHPTGAATTRSWKPLA